MNPAEPNPFEPRSAAPRRPSAEQLARMLALDAQFEPPARAVRAACGLGTMLAARRSASALTSGVCDPFAAIGELLDRAGAAICDWLTPQGELAFAGLRDDRGADLLALDEPRTGMALRAERTPAADGSLRLVGEASTLEGGMPLRARLVQLDGDGRVVAVDATDGLGMFAIELRRETRELAIVRDAGADETNASRTLILALTPRSDR